MSEFWQDLVIGTILLVICGLFAVSCIAISYRHAIPKAPHVFQWLTITPGVGVAVSALALSFNVLADGDWIIFWAIAFFLGVAVERCAFIAYSVFDARRNVRESHSHAEDISQRMGDAEIREEDEFSERQQEQGDVRERLEAAELVSRQELAEMESRIYAKLEGILEAVRESKDRRGE